ncbi:MAG: hypothetical protein AB7T06_23020 [Kofleriaceae bacterium]
MRALVAIAFVMTGCYRPDVAPCFLACGANQSCPDGLSCNGQGMCASAASEMCSDMPMNDSGMDSTPPVLTNVMFDVIDSDGAGQNDVRIVFSTPGGVFIKEARTLPNGHVAVSDVPVGSSATIIRVVGTRVTATTYLDLWPDARIVSRLGPNTTQRMLAVSWSSPAAGVTNYDVYASCAAPINTNATTLALSISNNCPTADVIVIARDATAPVRIATIAGVAPSVGDFNIGAAMWRTFGSDDDIAASLTNVRSSHQVRLSGFITNGLGASGAISEAIAAPNGNLPSLFFPTELSARVEIYSTTQTPRFFQQFYFETIPPDTLTYQRDMGPITFPWIDFTDPFDVSSNAITWPITTPSGPIAQPSIVFAKLSFSRGGDTHTWRIIGPGNRITTTPTMGSFELPDIPGDNPFEPTTTDTSFNEEMGYLRVTPGMENAVRERIESREQSLDIFGIPGLTYVMKAWAY